MTMLAETKGTGVLTLADYEARIHLYREQIGTGYIGIGRTLNEAKEAGVVPHGEWEEWVTRTTGLNTRQAQRCMQAAREIRDGSALARLEMSKALMLLASGLSEEEQEQAAGKAADEGQSVRELREEIQRLRNAAETERADSGQIIKQLKQKIVEESGASAEIRIQLRQAKAERDQLAGQLEATQAAYRQRMDEETEKAYKDGMQEGRENAERDVGNLRNDLRIAREKEEQTRRALEKAKKDNEYYVASISRNLDKMMAAKKEARAEGEAAGMQQAMEQQAGALAAKEKEIAELQAELDAAEAREAKRAQELAALKREKAQSGMDAARGIGGTALGALDLSAAVRTFIGAAGVLPQMGALISGMSESEREMIRANVETVGRWVADSRQALGIVVADATVQ